MIFTKNFKIFYRCHSSDKFIHRIKGAIWTFSFTWTVITRWAQNCRRGRVEFLNIRINHWFLFSFLIISFLIISLSLKFCFKTLQLSRCHVNISSFSCYEALSTAGQNNRARIVNWWFLRLNSWPDSVAELNSQVDSKINVFPLELQA